MTKMCYHQVAPRAYALRFDPLTPDHVIESAVREANELITAQVKGLVFFPFEAKPENFRGVMVKAVHLHADDQAWQRFRARGISTMPLLTRRVDALVACRRKPADLGHTDLAMAS